MIKKTILKIAIVPLYLAINNNFAFAVAPQAEFFVGQWQGSYSNSEVSINWQVTRDEEYMFVRQLEICDSDQSNCETSEQKGIWNVYNSYFSYQYKVDEKDMTEFYIYEFSVDGCLGLRMENGEKSVFQDLINKQTIGECQM